jgi:soluble lytic murein transglycosylase-like protein
MQQLIELLLILLRLWAPLPTAAIPAEPFEQRAFRLTQNDRYDPLILVAAQEWKIDPFLFKGLLFAESGFKPRKTNKLGAAGIAQLTGGGRIGVRNVRCMRGLCRSFTLQDALSPEKAIPAAAELLAYLRRTCGEDRMLSAYNTGNCKARVRVFVMMVTQHTNRFRTLSGLPPLPTPTIRPARLLAQQNPPNS